MTPIAFGRTLDALASRSPRQQVRDEQAFYERHANVASSIAALQWLVEGWKFVRGMGDRKL